MRKNDDKASVFNPDPIECRISTSLIEYPIAITEMEKRATNISNGMQAELIWFLQHPPLYSAGTSAQSGDLVDPDRFPVFETGRGGQYTYHGPGQRVVYVMLDLKKRGRDVRLFVCALEDWIIETLAGFGLEADRREGRIGVWVDKPDGSEAKIAALGVRIKRWVSYHGISINIDPDLSHFTGIVPCGIAEHGITSLSDMGIKASMEDVDTALQRNFKKRFGPLNS